MKLVAGMDRCHDLHCTWGAAKLKIANTPSGNFFLNLLHTCVLIFGKTWYTFKLNDTILNFFDMILFPTLHQYSELYQKPVLIPKFDAFYQISL